MMPTPVVIALCVAGIVVTGPLLWTSTWWWPRIAVATKSRQHGSPDLRAQPTSGGSVGEIDNDLERFRACLPHVQRCRKLISPFTGTLGTVEIALQVLRIGSATFGEIATELEHLAKQLSRDSPDQTDFPEHGTLGDKSNYKVVPRTRHCPLTHSNSPLSWGNHCTAKRKIPKRLVFAQVSPLGSPFALYDPITLSSMPSLPEWTSQEPA